MKVILHKLPGAAISQLEQKLLDSNIEFKEDLEKRGQELYPALEVDGKVMDYKEAIDWVELYE